jgi:carbon dioxide concentrating mechanism protein CcmN
MSQRAPSLVSGTHYCVVGDVTIDATAAIAPGVVLQAPSGSRIVVGKNACLAAGVCIQSRQGVLNIEAGVSLGANVLVIGHGTIGVNSCISAGSTLINPALTAETIVPPDSLVGAQPVPVANYSTSTNGVQSSYLPNQPSSDRNRTQANSSGFSQNGFSQNGFSQNGSANGSSSLSVKPSNSPVYGRDQISELISTLFPHRQPLDK